MDPAAAKPTRLDHGDILIAEFNYITQTAFQANEDRARVSSYYLVSVAAVIGAVFGAKIDGTSVFLVNLAFGVLFAILSLVGATTLLQLARLRSAWDESAVAMNMIKCYYATHLSGEALDAAFFWKTSTLRWKRNHFSVSFLLAISVIVISSVMAVIAVGYGFTALQQFDTPIAASRPPAALEGGMAAVRPVGAPTLLAGLVLAVLLGCLEYYLYWWMIDSERSDRELRLERHFAKLVVAGPGAEAGAGAEVEAGTGRGKVVEAMRSWMKRPEP